jgi:hypothetical protein
MTLRTLSATFLMTAVLSGLPPSRVSAQAPRPPVSPAAPQPPPPAGVTDRRNALETRAQFEEILAAEPPALVQVLRLDPMLLTNAEYLAPYPDLRDFLAQHPEVARNPRFYVGDVRPSGTVSSRSQAIQAIEEMSVGIGIFLFFMTALATITHVGRSILEHRRWLHATKIQTDAHAKLVDRLASNEDLMAYVQSPAGQRFLSATPLVVDGEGRVPGAPIGRILGSLQIGVVGAFAGAGLWIARSNVIEEVALPLQVIATLAVALGLGFIVSAAASFLLSRQLGLIRPSSSNA